MTAPLTRWSDLSPARQLELREAYADEMAKQAATCSVDEKITRFAAWLEPQGISFGADDLRRR